MSAAAVVTGGSGWLGRRLVRALHHGLEDVEGFAADAGRPVHCLAPTDADRAVVAAESADARCVAGDLRSAESLSALFEGGQGTVVFHCAGLIHPRRVRDFYAVNVDGTANLLRAAVRAGARRFVHVSSNSPIGCGAHPGDVFDETAPYHPYMHYGRSKKLAEDLVNAAQARGEIETVILRPPWFYGPGQPPRQTLFFRMIKEGRMPMVGPGTNTRSMAYVDNIVQGLLLAERCADAAGRTYWIADRRPYPMTEIVGTVSEVLEMDFGMTVAHRQMRLPGLASEVALLADKMIQGVGLYHQKLHVLSEMNKTIACSIARAERELGYAPAVALREGMRRSVQALLDDGETI